MSHSYPVPDLPRHRHHTRHAVRKIHRARQYFGGRNTRALCHVEPQFTHPGAQLLDVDRRRRHDHRVRRFGGPRGTDRTDVRADSRARQYDRNVKRRVTGTGSGSEQKVSGI